ncbi:hypothetical protein K504DRAFT_476092 [Pleomassaria siparia CBS 279.74]|uniref:Copper-fist domain-containing protein n=1 Tax=Pleomassaria siparia CBS 279.74 TaxID=1314801 RepID=A0A6G1KBE2_9PLEO|nr:hypothetical protein K504DRAFT_476092 [Pleomassaria siparia CBS 279.74]
MWADINGDSRKVACGPCIRGHRSSKCDHKDRVLVEVRKPGRPLSSCPHPGGSCSCERVVINYTIPKTSGCACPSERTPTISSLAGAGNRVQKPRARKLTNSLTPASLEKAIKSSQHVEPDTSSALASTPTNTSFPPSERSTSNQPSTSSSASSTPRMPPSPSPSRKQSYSTDFRLSNVSTSSDSRPPTSHSDPVSDCCKPKLEPMPQQGGSCCSNRNKEPPKVMPVKKSCCSAPKQPSQVDVLAQANQGFGNFPPPQQPGQYHNAFYGMMNPNFNYNLSGNVGMPVPYGFNTPIYNHVASVYPQPAQIPNVPMHNGAGHTGTHSMESNCHCGDGCSCFGCAAHPNNATMIEYIRQMHQFQSTGGFGTMPPPTYDMPTYSQHQVAQRNNFVANPSSANFPPVSLGQMSFPAHPTPTMNMVDMSMHMPSPWQHGTTPTAVQTPPVADAQHFRPNPPLVVRTEEPVHSPVTAFADSPSDVKDEDTPTLSPSSYFWQALELPGCNDATGTCQCGDGCECVGCLTHGGHNGVPLEVPAAPEPEAYAQFMDTPRLIDSPFHDPHAAW